MKITKERIKILLEKNDALLSEIYNDDTTIKTYYVHNTNIDSDFNFSTSSLQFVPLNGWCVEVEQILKKSFRHVHKAIYEIANQPFYPPYLMFEDVRHNMVESPIIRFKHTSEKDREEIEAEHKDSISPRIWAQNIKSTRLDIPPINWVDNKQKGVDHMDNLEA